MSRKCLILLLLVASALLLFGCGETSRASEPVDFASLERIGTQEGEYVYELAIENRSGFSITALSAKCEATKEFTGNALKKDDPFSHGETRLLCFAAASPATAPENYEMSLVLGRDLFRTLHSIPFSQTDQCTLLSDGDYCYLEYSNADGEMVSTKTLEKSYYEEEKAKSGSNDGCIGNEGLVY